MLEEPLAILSTLQDPGCKAQPSFTNKLVLNLVNIEQATIDSKSKFNSIGGSQTLSKQALQLNLHVLVAADFDRERYQDGLCFLSESAEFYHQHALLERSNCPELPANIERLAWDIENLGLSDLSHVWGLIGKNSQPCLFYKLRVIPIEPKHVVGEAALTRSASIDEDES